MAIGFKKPEEDQKDQEPVNTVDDLTEQKDDEIPNKKPIAIVAAVVAVVLVVGVIIGLRAMSNKGGSSDATTNNISQNTTQESSDGSSDSQSSQGSQSSDANTDQDAYNGENVYTPSPTPESNQFTEGDPNYEDSTKNKTTNKIVSADDFVKDLEGDDVSAVYQVEHREYVDAHVSYTAHRAIVDDGMELYWIDVEYKGKKYKVQVPFYYFKDFGDTGICKVNMEVLYLENGGQVISYMQVIAEDSDSEN